MIVRATLLLREGDIHGTGVFRVQIMNVIPTELIVRKHNLPHWQQGGQVYFVTFHTVGGEMSNDLRRIVRDAILYEHNRRIRIFVAVVMLDHVHILCQPLESETEKWFDLSKVLQSIKGVSARKINLSRGNTGQCWMHESFDRIIRNEREFLETFSYILNNPVRRNLTEKPEDYEFLIIPQEATAL